MTTHEEVKKRECYYCEEPALQGNILCFFCNETKVRNLHNRDY